MNTEKYKQIAGAVLCEIDRRCQKVSRPIPEEPGALWQELLKISRICEEAADAMIEDGSYDNDLLYEGVEKLIKKLKDEDSKAEGDGETT